MARKVKRSAGVSILIASFLAMSVMQAGAALFSDAKSYLFGSAPEVHTVPEADFLSLSVTDLDGSTFTFDRLKDKVTLITNVASKWGKTKENYEEMVALYAKLKSEGLEIVAFPSNEFGGQEPGTDQEIKKFVNRFGAEFPIVSKVEVNGENQTPVYKLLKGDNGNDIRWNFFTKFLVKCHGGTCSIWRYDGMPKPSSLAGDISRLLSGQQEL